MKELNLKEVFCELLSGFIAIIVTFLYLDLLNVYRINLNEINISAEMIIIFLLLSYLVGLVVDALGLAMGELFLDKIITCVKPPDADKKKTFWSGATAEKQKYREEQWTYYSLYRNLSILFILGLIAIVIMGCRHGFTPGLIALIAVLIAVEAAFLKSMNALLKLYYTLTE